MSLNHFWEILSGMADIRNVSQGNNRDKGRADHLLISSLMVLRTLGSFSSNILLIGDLIIIPIISKQKVQI